MIHRRALFGLGAGAAAAAVGIKTAAPPAQFATGGMAYANGFSIAGDGAVGEYIVPPHTYDAMRRLAAQFAELPMDGVPSMVTHPLVVAFEAKDACHIVECEENPRIDFNTPD